MKKRMRVIVSWLCDRRLSIFGVWLCHNLGLYKPTWHNVYGDEPDMSCSICGDDHGF